MRKSTAILKGHANNVFYCIFEVTLISVVRFLIINMLSFWNIEAQKRIKPLAVDNSHRPSCIPMTSKQGEIMKQLVKNVQGKILPGLHVSTSYINCEALKKISLRFNLLPCCDIVKVDVSSTIKQDGGWPSPSIFQEESMLSNFLQWIL